jgi:hypothetical protein
MGWAAHVAYKEERRNAHKILVRKPKRRPRSRQNDDFKQVFKDAGWIHVAKDVNQRTSGFHTRQHHAASAQSGKTFGFSSSATRDL